MKKIHFFICYSNENNLSRCIGYINELRVPDDIEIGISAATEADNISEAYNALQTDIESDLYVYLQENVYIVNRDFVEDCFDIYENDEKVGAIGVLGVSKADTESKFGEWDLGSLEVKDLYGRISIKNDGCKLEKYADVISGHLIVTKRKYEWNSLTGGKNGYYEVALSRRITQEGLKLFVPNQFHAWCIYERGISEYERTDVYTQDRGCKYLVNEADDDELVTVIMSVYNGGNFISETIESILNQTYSKLQVLIVDDCSKDNSRDIIDYYAKKDSRIEAIYLDRNSNICTASNIAYKKAKGKYIAIIGHDDVWLPEKIGRQVNFLRLNEDVGVVFTLCDVIDDNSNICSHTYGQEIFDTFNQRNLSRKEWARKLFFEGNHLCAPSAVVRKSMIKDKFYETGILQCQDWDLWLRMLLVGDIYILQERLTKYRRFFGANNNLSNMDRTKINRSWHESAYVLDRFMRIIPDELFCELFYDELIIKHPESSIEICCEKAFILKKKDNIYWTNWIMDLLGEEKSFDILASKYDFHETDYYKFNSEGMLFDKSVLFELYDTQKLLDESMKLIKRVEQFIPRGE